MSATGSGVFLEEDELAVVKTLVEQASRTLLSQLGPFQLNAALFAFGHENTKTILGLAGPDLASMAWKNAKDRLYKYCLAHGLPEITGYYGIDLQTGEVLK
jgi:hypothetical protein